MHSKHFFELFQLPVSYDVNLQHLSSKYLELQQQFHPDKHAQAVQRDQLLVQQYATYINDGYETLKSPVKRAQHLLSLCSADESVLNENASLNDVSFLMAQMQYREYLEEVNQSAQPEKDIEVLRDQISQEMDKVTQQLTALFDQAFPERTSVFNESVNLKDIVKAIQKLQFFVKLLKEVDDVEDQLFDS